MNIENKYAKHLESFTDFVLKNYSWLETILFFYIDTKIDAFWLKLQLVIIYTFVYKHNILSTFSIKNYTILKSL